MGDYASLYKGSLIELESGASDNTGKPLVRLLARPTVPGSSAKAISVVLDRAPQLHADLRASARALRQAFGIPEPAPVEGSAARPGTVAPTVASKPSTRQSAAKPGLAKRDSLSFGLKFGLDRILREFDVILHVGDGEGADFHIDLWRPYLVAGGARVLVVVRSIVVMDKLEQDADFDVVYVKEGRDAEVLVGKCVNLKAVFYTSNTGNTIHFIRFNHLTHVFLGHGDSEKAASCHKFFRVYDEVWTAGQAHVDRFRLSGLRFGDLELKIVGRPQMRAALGAPLGARGDASFLYLPTWEGYHHEQNYSSLPIAPAMIAAVASLTGKQPRVKFHPWTGRQMPLPALREAGFVDSYGAAAIAPDMLDRSAQASDAMASSSFLVTDISSVITDYLVTGRPIFMYVPPAGVIRTSGSKTAYTDYVYPFRDGEELAALVRRVIVEGDDTLAEARQTALDYFIDVTATLDDGFERAVAQLLKADPEPETVSVDADDYLAVGEVE